MYKKILNSPCSLVYLKDLSLISIKGEDSINYLQSKFTADISNFDVNNYIICAHCNAKGKVWSNLILFFFQNKFSYIVRKSILKIQIIELKKYSLFSKVNIQYDKNITLLGVLGLNCKVALNKIFKELPNKKQKVLKNKYCTLLWFEKPVERFLILVRSDMIEIITSKLSHFPIQNSNKWLALDISSGYPIIDEENIIKFLPQSLNLEKFNGINIKKGCYSGQEIITKISLRNLNKKFIYWLIGNTKEKINIGENLEIKIFNKNIIVGTILSKVKFKNNDVWIQGILRKDLIDQYNSKIIFYKKNEFFIEKIFLNKNKK